jgi:FKBP-type peptidyl-prolyl cis-trans isomerase (trigger factor)
MNITLDNLTIDQSDSTSIINEEYTMVIVDNAGEYWESCVVVDVQVKNVNTFNIVEITDSNDNDFVPSNLDELKNKIQELVDNEVFAIHEGKYSNQGAW